MKNYNFDLMMHIGQFILANRLELISNTNSYCNLDSSVCGLTFCLLYMSDSGCCRISLLAVFIWILLFVVVSFQWMRNRQLEVQYWQNTRKKAIHITQVPGTIICNNYIVLTTVVLWLLYRSTSSACFLTCLVKEWRIMLEQFCCLCAFGGGR